MKTKFLLILSLFTIFSFTACSSETHAPKTTQKVVTTQVNTSNPFVVLKTTKGDLEIELYKDIAPLAVENFMTHIKEGYYNGIAFHRIIKDFMIQGGDPTESGRGGESIWHKAVSYTHLTLPTKA